jgi:hypothetical protein
MDGMLSSLDRRFAAIDRDMRALVERLTEAQLFEKPASAETARLSCGEAILRAGAIVEKTFGGITTRLWDDPFEWTLPEKLSSRTAVLEYLDEVEETRRRGFSFFRSDADLLREMPAPECLRPIIDILLEAIAHASYNHGRASAVFHIVTGQRPPSI